MALGVLRNICFIYNNNSLRRVYLRHVTCDLNLVSKPHVYCSFTNQPICSFFYLNTLKTKRRLLYSKTQFVRRSKHF